MNPAQYKQAMRQRALDRQAERDNLQLLETQHLCRDRSVQLSISAPRDSLAATHTPRRSSDIVRGGKDLLSRFDSEGDMAGAPTSKTSSAKQSAFGLDELHLKKQSGQLSVESIGEELSPIAPGPLDGFRNGKARFSGFDKQAGFKSTGINGVSPRDDLWEDSGEEEEEEEEKEKEEGFAAQRRDRRMLGWERFPGETSITSAVRMYFANLDPDASHKENCGVVLYQILERVATEELAVPALKMRHVIKMEAFLRAVVLSVPARTWQQSFRGAFTLSAPGQHISEDELMFRVSLFVSMMRAERAGADEVDEAIDPMRVESVVRGYAANAAEILPLQRPAKTLLPPLLYCMACEMLNVRLLAPEVRGVCRQIVSDYEARAKLWMSPAQNAEQYLRPLVTEFTSWMRCNKDILYQGSATEGLLRSIDERLRTSLKNQVYRSPQHFLAVLKSLEVELMDMPLPSYDPSGGDDDHPFDVCQTVKDVSRERFDVNRVPTKPSDCWCKIRASLLHAALEHHSDSAKTSELGADNGDGGVLVDVESISLATSQEDVLGNLDSSTLLFDTAVGEEATASGDAAAGKGVSPGGNGVGGEGKAGKGKVWGVGNKCKGGMKGNRRPSKSGLEMYVDQCAWRVLHAASRTASGGDCFFVVQDLFGGDGVLVKMATAATEPIKIRTKGMAARVTTVDKYDIYHTSDVDINSACSEASPRPLMTITTTMKEVVQFAPCADTSARRKSAMFAEEHASQSLEESASTPPSHAWSGRFITISADLPDYPEHHLDAAAGVLVATPSAAPSPERAQRLQNRVAVSSIADSAALAVNGESTLPPSNSAGAGPPSPVRPIVYGPTSLGPRPSAFNSPPPAPPPEGRETLANSEISPYDSSGSSPCWSGDEEEGGVAKGIAGLR